MIVRLRQYGEIVGYRKQVRRYTFFSVDLYGWSNKNIDFDMTEEMSTMKNQYGHPVFENDVIFYDGLPVQVTKKNNSFVLVDIISGEALELNPCPTSVKLLFPGTFDRDTDLSMAKMLSV